MPFAIVFLLLRLNINNFSVYQDGASTFWVLKSEFVFATWIVLTSTISIKSKYVYLKETSYCHKVRTITITCPSCHVKYRFFLHCKNWKLSVECFYIFLIFAQNIDCENKYPQSMFKSKTKKNRCTPAYPSFTR